MSRYTRVVRRCLGCTVLFVLILTLCTNSWTWSSQLRDQFLTLGRILSSAEDYASTSNQCVIPLPPLSQPPAPVNLWGSLTPEEMMMINDWLFDPARNLNLTVGEHAALSDNLVFRIEADRPPKAIALAYLSSPSEGRLPEKYARVTIHHGARKDENGGPVIKDYLVGPLPIDDRRTVMTPLTEVYHRDEIPFNARAHTKPSELSPFLATLMSPIAEVTQVSTRLKHVLLYLCLCQDLLGGVFHGKQNDTLISAGSGPMSFDGSFRRTWLSWSRNVAGSWLHPLGFYLYVDSSGTDSNKWKLLKVRTCSLLSQSSE